jgi:nuclear transport factor 2 (NTF2) superfamily protein
MSRPPLPPFTAETAAQKARMAEDAWNTRDPARVALAYTTDSRWRNRSEFLQGRAAIEAFLTRKWNRELDYRLIKEVWTFRDNRIAVRFAYEWHDDGGNWFRSYGNENWEFDEDGLMRLRIASINDLPIKESERKYHWPLGRRPDDHPSLSELGPGAPCTRVVNVAPPARVPSRPGQSGRSISLKIVPPPRQRRTDPAAGTDGGRKIPPGGV